MKKKCKSVLLLVSLLFFFHFYLFHSELLVKEIISYSILFLKNIFPTSFTFLLLSFLLIENNLFYYLQKIIKQKSLYFFIISLLSGFPAGALHIKEALLRNDITTDEANNYIMFSHFPNPLFIIYNCNKVFSNSHLAIIFYGIIILSQLIICLFVSKKTKSSKKVRKEIISFTNSFNSSLTKTISILITIYGSSIFFYLTSHIIMYYLFLPKYLYIACIGTFDLTKGIIASSMINNITLKGMFLYFFVVFGSIPIHIQIKSVLKDTSISYKSFIKGRIISLIICLIIWNINFTS